MPSLKSKLDSLKFRPQESVKIHGYPRAEISAILKSQIAISLRS